MSVNTELLKNRDFRNTLFAIGANQLSDSMSYITTPIIILALTGSPEAASITLFVAGVLATCAGAISGTWVDRIGPSKCLALSCIGQSLSWIAILLYLVFNVTNIYVLVITISLAAIISTFDYPSEQSIITRVVPKEHLGYASGMGETRESTANLLGGPVAGIIIGFSTVLMTAVHAVVNLLAFIVAPKTYGASRQPTEEEEGEKTSFWQDSKAGFEYILKNKVLVSIAFVSTLANFGTVGIPLTFIYYYTLEGAHPLFIGIFASAFGNLFHATVVEIAVTIKNYFTDSGLECLFGHDFTHLEGLFLLGACFLTERRGCDEGLSSFVVDDLNVDLLVAAEHAHTRTSSRAGDLIANAILDLYASCFFLFCHNLNRD